MAITSISVVVTVVVLNFHFRGPSRKEVPSYLRDLVLQRVNTSCFCFRSPKRKKPCTTYDTVHLPASFKGGESFRMTVDSLHEELKEMNPDLSCNESSSSDLTSGKRRSHPIPTSKVNGSSPGSQCATKVQEEILRTLRYILQRQEQEDHRVRVVNEWRQMALVIDRILFWIFFVVTVVSSLSFLVIVPLHRRGLQFT